MTRLAILAVLVAAPVFAQATPVALGDRIRVHAPESGYEKLIGRVTQTTPDMISLKVDGSQGEFYIRRSEIVFLYKSVARHRNTKRGLGIGTALGLGAGIWFGPRSGSANGGNLNYDSGRVLKNALMGAGGGALIGGIIGFAVRTDTWQQLRRQ